MKFEKKLLSIKPMELRSTFVKEKCGIDYVFLKISTYQPLVDQKINNSFVVSCMISYAI